MATLALRDVRKSYGEAEVIRGVDLDVADREFVVFVGPSGCGKSTLLRMIAGLEEITSGELLIDGERENDTPPARRGLAMVFQSYALYPHMTVAENMSFSLRLQGKSKAERRAAAEKAARILRLEAYLDRRPRALSGGQRQRVAIGRAIVRDPKIFLFDEPLSNLDAALRVQMRTELARLHDELAATMIYVTHDQIEAMTLADKIVVLRDGLIEQVGAPLELYHHPANLFVAGFIGSPTMNILEAAAGEGGAEGVEARLPSGGAVTAPVRADGLGPGAPVRLGVRPEHVTLAEDGPLTGEVVVTERLGGATFVHVRDGAGHTLIAQADGGSRVRLHDRVALRFDPDHLHLFRPEGPALPLLRRNPLADLPAH
jgi:multiple sugar transport system ATP-binding protein